MDQNSIQSTPLHLEWRCTEAHRHTHKCTKQRHRQRCNLLPNPREDPHTICWLLGRSHLKLTEQLHTEHTPLLHRDTFRAPIQSAVCVCVLYSMVKCAQIQDHNFLLRLMPAMRRVYEGNICVSRPITHICRNCCLLF